MVTSCDSSVLDPEVTGVVDELDSEEGPSLSDLGAGVMSLSSIAMTDGVPPSPPTLQLAPKQARSATQTRDPIWKPEFGCLVFMISLPVGCAKLRDPWK